MIKNVEFDWNEENGFCICYLTDENNELFTGDAQCHIQDEDMKSQKVGEEIPYRRAKINKLCASRDHDLKPRLAALKQLYYSMAHSKNFNPKSYENKMLQRQIRLLEFDLETIKEMLAYERESLKAYINLKDALYKKLRTNREGKSD